MKADRPEPVPTIRWAGGVVRIIDQRRLPRVESQIELRTPAELARAVRVLAVRGAPALGIAGAYGLALAALRAEEAGRDPLVAARRWAPRLAEARPTAVNLAAGVAAAISSLAGVDPGRPGAVVRTLCEAGDRMLRDDLEFSRLMAIHGAPLIPAGRPVLTHCNTGGLATAGGGTALAVIWRAWRDRGVPFVLVDETRPLLQGGRLTMWELRRWGVPARLICDGAAAWAIRRYDAGAVLVGADRIAGNGDTANKIGTLGAALAAKQAGIPFIVVAPRTSFDLTIPQGDAIPVEERSPDEILAASGWRPAAGEAAFNPAFDVTPAGLISAWVSERGVETPPFED